MTLPIDVVANTHPPRFKWRQKITTPIGPQTVQHDGLLPPSVEEAIADLIAIAKRLSAENEDLRKINQTFADRIAAQSELLSKKAEATIPQAKRK